MIKLQDRASTILNPVEIDDAIEKMRLLLATLPWVSHPFHMAFKYLKVEDGRLNYYPLTYTAQDNGKYNYHIVTPDNDYKGMFFFYVDREIPMNDNFLEYNLGIIFSCNLKLIDSAKLENYLFTQELIRDVRKMLTEKMMYLGLQYKINYITRDLRDVFKDFSINSVKYSSLNISELFNRAPLQCFRFDLTLTLDPGC